MVRCQSGTEPLFQVTALPAMPVVMRAIIELLKAYPGSCSTLRAVTVGGSVMNVPWSEELISLLDLDTYRIRCVLMPCIDDHWVLSYLSDGKTSRSG